MAQNNDIKFALEFPQGRILCMKPDSFSRDDLGGVYFLPYESTEAFMVWGERKELFGKHAISVAKSDSVETPYSVVYEFSETGALIDARLVSKAETARGTLADEKTVQSLAAAIGAGTVTLVSPRDTEPAKIFNVAQFPDGRLLVQLMNKNELYLGKPGSYEKLDARLAAQGGCSMYYKAASGETIQLPWGYGGPNHETPTFGEQELVYNLKYKTGSDPATAGLDLSGGIVALNPFSPGLPAKPQAPALKPQPPRL